MAPRDPRGGDGPSLKQRRGGDTPSSAAPPMPQGRGLTGLHGKLNAIAGVAAHATEKIKETAEAARSVKDLSPEELVAKAVAGNKDLERLSTDPIAGPILESLVRQFEALKTQTNFGPNDAVHIREGLRMIEGLLRGFSPFFSLDSFEDRIRKAMRDQRVLKSIEESTKKGVREEVSKPVGSAGLTIAQLIASGQIRG